MKPNKAFCLPPNPCHAFSSFPIRWKKINGRPTLLYPATLYASFFTSLNISTLSFLWCCYSGLTHTLFSFTCFLHLLINADTTPCGHKKRISYICMNSLL